MFCRIEKCGKKWNNLEGVGLDGMVLVFSELLQKDIPLKCNGPRDEYENAEYAHLCNGWYRWMEGNMGLPIALNLLLTKFGPSHLQ